MPPFVEFALLRVLCGAARQMPAATHCTLWPRATPRATKEDAQPPLSDGLLVCWFNALVSQVMSGTHFNGGCCFDYGNSVR